MNRIEQWLTTADQQHLLEKQPALKLRGISDFDTGLISLDSSIQYQTVDGFGYTLTGGSAQLIHSLSPETRTRLLQEIFGKEENSLRVSYLRISIGASDLDPVVFSYDDIPAGEKDFQLNAFSLSRDTLHLIPVLKEILAINPSIKIMGSPWSPPIWMKDNQASKAGSLIPACYEVYAAYFVKYIREMQQMGITIDAVTPQNEPLHPGNNPSMYFPATEEAAFIRNQLGPAFAAAGLKTKIIVYDHNCDKPEYPLTILNDSIARNYVSGSAFHLYAGDISTLSAIHDSFPDKGVYFTEQWTGAKSSFAEDLQWHVKNVLIGSMNNYAKIALEWNLANNEHYEPHTTGGCTECRGAITIGTNGSIQKNVSWYIIGHASRFIPPGARRIKTTGTNGLSAAAFLTPEKKIVLIVLNEGAAARNFNIEFNQQRAVASLDAGAVATYTW